jgi:hypothetical protein
MSAKDEDEGQWDVAFCDPVITGDHVTPNELNMAA